MCEFYGHLVFQSQLDSTDSSDCAVEFVRGPEGYASYALERRRAIADSGYRINFDSSEEVAAAQAIRPAFSRVLSKLQDQAAGLPGDLRLESRSELVVLEWLVKNRSVAPPAGAMDARYMLDISSGQARSTRAMKVRR